MKFAYCINSSNFLHSHFAKLALNTLAQGHEVHLIVGDEEKREEFEKRGFRYHTLPLSRASREPGAEMRVFKALRRILGQVKPDVLHSLTAKPVLYSGLLCRFDAALRPKLLVLSMTGLGTMALASKLRGRLFWRVVRAGYGIAFSVPYVHVFFENDDDRNEFVAGRLVAAESASLVHGAGIDTSYFRPPETKPSNARIRVVFLARLLKDKGIREFAEAARLLLTRGVNVEMIVAGDIDPHNVSSMSEREVSELGQIDNIRYLGHVDQVRELYQQSDIACLPSYREGLPKSLIEAAACGLPIITTDTPGCRQLVDRNHPNGMLVKVKDPVSLADAIEYLATHSAQREAMGVNSRRMALAKFDYSSVIGEYQKVYERVAPSGDNGHVQSIVNGI